jgi:hypothetical protein
VPHLAFAEAVEIDATTSLRCDEGEHKVEAACGLASEGGRCTHLQMIDAKSTSNSVK